MQWKELLKTFAGASDIGQSTRAHAAGVDPADSWTVLADFSANRGPTLAADSGARPFRGSRSKFQADR
jgi:hypothetical protein